MAVLLVALVAISVVNTGYRYFCDNHALQLPLVEKILDPGLFPNDPFVETLTDYESWVWWIIAKLSQIVDLKWVLLVSFLLTRCLLVYSCARVGAALVPDSPLAMFGAAALAALVPQSILGNGNLTEVYFEQTSLFVPLFMLALAYLLEGKAVRFYVFWALAFLINPMYGSWAGIFFLGTYLIDTNRPGFKVMLRTAPIFVLLVTPIVVQGFLALSQPKPDPGLWSWAIRLLNSPHLAPSTWPLAQFRDFALFGALVIAIGLLVRRSFPRVQSLTSMWTALACGFLTLGIVVGRTDRWLEILVLQPARATDLFYLSAGVAIVAATADLVVQRPTAVRILLFTGTFSATGYLLSPSFRHHAVWAMLLMGVVVAGLVAVQRRWRPEIRIVRGPVWLAVSVMGVLMLAMFGSFQERAEKWRSREKALVRGPDAQIVAIADWARRSTAEDAIFFHDPIHWDWAQFRYLADRPVYATWKDASAVLWDPPYTEEWSRRFAAFGFRDQWRDRWDISKRGEIFRMRSSMRLRYNRLKPSDIRLMLRDFDIDYWIAPRKAWSKNYPVVFETEHFKVLKLH